jgi:hypothetical protein
MPLASLYTTTYLLSTICNRPLGNSKTASEFCKKGLDLIDSEYKFAEEGKMSLWREERICDSVPTAFLQKEIPESGTMANHTRADFIYSLLRNKFSLLENRVYINLAECKLRNAICVRDPPPSSYKYKLLLSPLILCSISI